jgi:hypothetical protein
MATARDAEVITGSDDDESEYHADVDADVERSFSRYNSVLREDRESFTPKNLAMYMFIHCNDL